MFTRFQALVRDYFGISHREARGVLVLILITVLLLLTPWLYRRLVPETIADTAVSDQRTLDSLVALMKTDEAKQPRYADRNDRYTRDEADKTTTERFSEPKLFRFDPNTVSVTGWQQLGLPRWMAQRIDKYRSKGGQFRKKEDLLRIYDFPPDLYEQLEPYIQLPEVVAYSGRSGGSSSPAVGASVNEATASNTSRFSRPAYTKPALQPFDINQADTAQLIALKGIGSKLASRIVKFRDALGGFADTDQYHDVFGLDSLALNELMQYGKIQSPVQKMAINTATAEELDHHVYLSRRQAEVIVNYRTQHGPFTSIESLRPIRILDAKTLDKLAPYLSF